MSTDLTVTNGKSAALTAGFTKEQADIIRKVVAKDATDEELAFFLSFCKSKGLDPFSREVYFTKRVSRSTGVASIAIQTGIDGFRSQAESTGEYDGQEGPYWCGEDGKWTDVWLSKTPPSAAKVGILRKGKAAPFWAIAKWTEYYPKSDTWMWDKMPANQLAKCAEALAFRKAFPRQMGGLYADAEMDQAKEPEGRRGPKAATGGGSTLSQEVTRGMSTVSTTEISTSPATADPKEHPAVALAAKVFHLSSPSADGAGPSENAAQSTEKPENDLQQSEPLPERIRTTDEELAALAEPDTDEELDFVEHWEFHKQGSSKAHTATGEWIKRESPSQRRTLKQNARLNVLRNLLELSDDDWHAGIKRYYNKESSRDLSIEEATDMISKLETRYNQRKHKTPTAKLAAKWENHNNYGKTS